MNSKSKELSQLIELKDNENNHIIQQLQSAMSILESKSKNNGLLKEDEKNLVTDVKRFINGLSNDDVMYMTATNMDIPKINMQLLSFQEKITELLLKIEQRETQKVSPNFFSTSPDKSNVSSSKSSPTYKKR